MKHIFTFLLFSFSFLSFSQVITFECNNEVIIVSFDEIANDINAYTDWNADGAVDEEDYLIYLLGAYGCDDNGGDGDDGGRDRILSFQALSTRKRKGVTAQNAGII